MKTIKIILFFALLSSFQACKTTDNGNKTNNSNSDNPNLNNSTWYFKSMSGIGKDLTDFPGTEIKFNNGSYSLKLSVNDCTGNYKTNGKTLELLEGMACTKMCCDNAVSDKLKAAFRGNFSIEKTEKELILKGEKNTFYLSNEAPSKTASKLPGTSWIVSMVAKTGEEKKMKGVYKLSFREKSMGLQLDKNSCNSDCSYSSDKIMIGRGMGCTEMCCDSEEASGLGFLFAGAMSYTFEGEMLIIYNDKNRIWLNPAKKEAAIIDKALNGETLWGKSYKIYDINDLKMGVASHHAQAYIVTFNQAAFSLKLDVNSCNTTATYQGANISLSGMMGCTKMCCDSEESNGVKAMFKNSFELKQSGNYLVMSNKEYVLRLEEQK